MSESEKTPETRTVGIVRQVDRFGRFSIPKSIRVRLGLAEGTEVEFLTTVIDGENVVVMRKPMNDTDSQRG